MSNDYYLVDTKNKVALDVGKWDLCAAEPCFKGIGWLDPLTFGLAIWEAIYAPALRVYQVQGFPSQWARAIAYLHIWLAEVPALWAFCKRAEGNVECRDGGQLWPEEDDGSELERVDPLDEGGPYAEDLDDWERFWHMRTWTGGERIGDIHGGLMSRLAIWKAKRGLP